MHKKLKLKTSLAGFSLAEVLITLGIIGVVAAMTITVILKNTNEQAIISAWKKQYSNAIQAYSLVVNENGPMGDYDCYNGTGLEKYNAMKSKLSVIKECDGNTFGKCWAAGGVGENADLMGGYPLFYKNWQNLTKTFVLKDGSFWLLYGDGASVLCPIFAIDVNGARGPNLWDKDVFAFVMYSDKIQYLQAHATTYNSRDYLLK